MSEEKKSKQKILDIVIAAVLWFATSWLAVQEIFLARSLVTAIYFRVLDRFEVPINVLERLSATATGNLGALVMAIVAIVVVIGGFDYHWEHAGEKRSYQIFAWTFAFQFLFLLITNILI